MRPKTLITIIALGACAAVVPALAAPKPDLGAGCAANRPAIAYSPGGKALKPQPKDRPIPCGVTTGFGSAESHIVVTKSGAVIFTPAVVPKGTLGTGEGNIPIGQPSQNNANPAGLAITRNDGRTWSLVKPSGVTWNPTDHGDYIDPVTGRFFFEDYGPIPVDLSVGADQEGPAHINVSADEGRTWTHTLIPAVVLPENPRFTSAIAPVGGTKPTGYPRMTYFCANVNVGFVSPAIAGRTCYRSFNGGLQWSLASLILSGTVPVHQECGGNGEQYSAIDGYYPQPAPDGSLYLMVSCGGKTYLARSTDEASTFPVLHVQDTPVTVPLPSGAVPELRIDANGVMYLMWSVADAARAGGLPGGALNALYYRISKDSGRTWGPAIDITPAGIRLFNHVSWELHGPGEIAAGTDAQRVGHTGYDALIVATRTALSAHPVLYVGQLNDPRRPILYSSKIVGAGKLSIPPLPAFDFPPPFGFNFAGTDFIGTTYAPDGTPWASFTQDCGPDPAAPQCVEQNGQTRGFAGRLIWR